MRLRHIKGCEAFIEQAPECITENKAKEIKGLWHEKFATKAPVHIEIGCGKGQFAINMSQKYPDTSFIGIERYMSVLMKAVQRKRKYENEHDISLKNLLFICADAHILNEIFSENEVEKIYLNFSDPWPKSRHADRRLTSPCFLNIYSSILAHTGSLEFKTDNRMLFDYSLNLTVLNGWEIISKTYDLHNSEQCTDNVMSEYEEKFSKAGKKICRLTAVPLQKQI